MTHSTHNAQQQLAEAVRQARVAAALAAYEDAGLSGLCAEGRWEAAVSALRTLEFGHLLPQPDPARPGRNGTPAVPVVPDSEPGTARPT